MPACAKKWALYVAGLMILASLSTCIELGELLLDDPRLVSAMQVWALLVPALWTHWHSEGIGMWEASLLLKPGESLEGLLS